MKIYNLFCLVLLVAILIAFFEEGEFSSWWVGRAQERQNWSKIFFLYTADSERMFVHKMHVVHPHTTGI